MLKQHSCLVVNAAKEHNARVGSDQWRQDGIEIGFLFRALEAQHLHALGFGLTLEEFGNALTVGGLIMDHVGRRIALRCGKVRSHHALDIVTTDDTAYVFITAIGDFRVGVGRRYVCQH